MKVDTHTAGLCPLTRCPPAQPSQVGTLPSTAVITGAPTLTARAGNNVTLNAGSSECWSDPCTYAFEVACPGKPTNVTKTGASAVLSTGPGAAYDINMLDLPSGLTCTVVLTLTDSNAAKWTASAALQVGAVCAALRLQVAPVGFWQCENSGGSTLHPPYL